MKIKFDEYISSIAGASIVLVVFSILVRGIGFVREIVYAREFGLSKEFDLYLVASVIPLTLNTVIYFIGQNFFIPNYSRLILKDEYKSEQFLKVSFLFFGLFSFIAGLLSFIFADKLLYILFGPNSASDNLSISVFRIYSISIPVAGFVSILSAYFNYKKKFVHPALSALFLNIIIIVSVIIFNSAIGILSIAFGYLIGSIIQLIFLFYTSEVAQKKIFQKPTSIIHLKEYFNYTFLMIIIIESVGQVYAIADRLFFNYVSQGGISAINYAQTLSSLPITIITVSLGTAIFTKISNDINVNHSDVANSIVDSIAITLIIFIPIIFIFNFWGEGVVAVLLQRGKFVETDSYTTADALKYLNYGLIFYAVYAIFNKVMYSAKLIKQLLFITLSGIFLKILLNLIFVKYLDYRGLTLSTALSYLYFFITSGFILYKYFNFKWVLKSSYDFILLLTNGLFALLFTEILFSILNFSSFYFITLKLLIFIIIYLLNLLLVRHNQSELIFNHFLGPRIISKMKFLLLIRFQNERL